MASNYMRLADGTWKLLDGPQPARTGPEFLGQGWTHRVGSDSYGGYVVEIKELPNGKTIYGLANADSVMETTWEEGTMTCTMPKGAIATSWVIAYGKHKKTGLPKWWFCDANGARCLGRHCGFSWNGAYAYRDPSF